MAVDTKGQRGAAAVEMAIVLPVLVALLMGIIDFGWLFFVQATAAGAAREGVRQYAISGVASNGTTRAVAVGGWSGVSLSATASTAGTGSDCRVMITVSYSKQSMSRFFTPLLNGTGQYTAVMRCGG